MGIQPEVAAVAFGMLASASWGVSDFSGGMATKRSAVLGVVAVSHTIGLVLMLVFAVLMGEAFPPVGDLVWGVLAGLSGVVGLAAFYSALATGRMGIAAPITAILAAALPVTIGIAANGWPETPKIVGLILGIIGIWLVSYSSGKAHLPTVVLAIAAGIGFGGFLALIAHSESGAVLWPLVAARVASTTVMFLLVVVRRVPLPKGQRLLPVVVLAGGLDALGNVFYVLATQAGRLDFAAVVSSLYPAVTVMLAYVLLKEPIARIQIVGIVVALIAVSLIAL